MHTYACLPLLLLFAVALLPSQAHAALQAGIATRDITPEAGAPLWGYTRPAPSSGTLDPLYVRAVVFDSGTRVVALVMTDLGRPPARDAVDRIKARVKAAGVEDVFLSATHTHHAPRLELSSETYAQFIEEGIGACIEEAAAKVQPIKMGVGRTAIDISHNRRRITEDGKCEMVWRNVTRVPTGGPLDQEATLIRIDAMDDQPLAILVHYACHPVVMGPTNLQYSADYCGEMARRVKETTGAECFFLQGACGDINPYFDKMEMAEDGVAVMREVGAICAAHVNATVKTIVPEVPAGGTIDYREKAIPVGVRWDLEDEGQVTLLRAIYGPSYDMYISQLKEDLEVPLSLLLINNEIALVGMPGEIFVQFQLDLKAQSVVPTTLLCGYVNEYHSYFPTVQDAAVGGYGACMATYVGFGAADKLTLAAQLELGDMSGKLRRHVTQQDFIPIEKDQ